MSQVTCPQPGSQLTNGSCTEFASDADRVHARREMYRAERVSLAEDLAQTAKRLANASADRNIGDAVSKLADAVEQLAKCV